MAAPPRRPWLLGWFAAALLAGAYLRTQQFLFRRSLWMDEAILAINIPTRSLLDFLRPLDYNTSAPFPFLWVERASVWLFGANELSLRAFPLLTGLALIPLLGWLAYRLLGEAGAAAAVLLAALSPTLLRFSNEVKPYGSDAFFSVLVLATTAAAAQQPAKRRAWLALLLAAPTAVLSSYPAAFVAASALLALLLVPEIRGRHKKDLLALGGLCLVAFAVPYLAIYRTAAGSPELQGAWTAAFLEPAHLRERLRLALPGLLLPAFLGSGATPPPASLPAMLALVALLLLGLFEAARRQGAWAVALLAGPIAFAALASALRRYPFGVPRLMVFAAPTLLLMAAGAAAWLYGKKPRAVPGPILGLGLLLAVVPIARDDIAGIRAPFEGENSRALISAYRSARRGEQEPVYVGAKAIPAWIFYTTNWQAPKLDRLAFYAKAATHGLAFENRKSRGRPVADEGLDLVYEYRGRTEILGIATGREWRWPSYTTAGPDEGWTANEARRIHAEAVKNPANPCAWVFMTRLSERASRPLTWELRDVHRGVRELWVQAAGGVLYRYCFPAPGAARPSEDNDPR